MTAKISVDESCKRLDQAWRPRVIAALNGQEVKLIRVKGVFPWHRHDDADEFFLVWKGRFSVEYRDRRVDRNPGDCVLVPRQIVCLTASQIVGMGWAYDRLVHTWWSRCVVRHPALCSFLLALAVFVWSSW